MKRNKHRYITCGVVWKSPKIKNYRLLTTTRYSSGHVIRVNVSDIDLYKHPSDIYSTTNDDRTIHELGCDCYILYEGRWRKFNFLKNVEPYEWHLVLENCFGLYYCHDGKNGYTTDLDKYMYSRSREGRVHELEYGGFNFPHLKEDKNGLKLKVQLKDINWLRQNEDSNKERWVIIYDQFVEQLKENKNIICE